MKIETKIKKLSDVITFRTDISIGSRHILPLLDAATKVDVGCARHTLGLVTELPRFLIYLADDVFEYDDVLSRARCIRLLVRSDFEPDKNPATGGRYRTVKVLYTRLARGTSRDEILAALKQKCSATPWYSNSTFCSWKFRT